MSHPTMNSPRGLLQQLAAAVSRLFDPTILIPLMLAAAVAYSVVNGLRWRFILILLFIDGIIPFVYFVHLLRTKQISDWDTTDRRERKKLYGFTLLVHCVGLVTAALLGKPTLAGMLLVFWMLALVFFIVTLNWKISVHAGVSSAAVTFLVVLFGRPWAALYLVVALVSWARVSLAKHTLAQVLVGALIPPLVILAGFTALGITRHQARAPSQTNTLVAPPTP